MTFRNLLLAVVLITSVVGCASNEPAAAGAAASEPTSTTAALAKCAQCGKEVASAELVSHDGQMLCKECVASHGH